MIVTHPAATGIPPLIRVSRLLSIINLLLLLGVSGASTFAFWDTGTDNRQAQADYELRVLAPVLVVGTLATVMNVMAVSALKGRDVRRFAILSYVAAALAIATPTLGLFLLIESSGWLLLATAYGLGAACCFISVRLPSLRVGDRPTGQG